MAEPIRYGIVGDAPFVAEFLAATEENEKTSVTGIVADADFNLAKDHGVKVYATLTDLLAENDVDVIYITSDNKSHFAHAKEALEAQKHVILERPFTSHRVGAAELFALAKKQGCFIMEAQVGMCLPIFHKVADLVSAGKLGEIRYAEVKGYYKLADQASWFTNLAAGGGALNLGGSYPLQAIPYLTGQAVSEWSGHCINANGQADTRCTLSFKCGHVLTNCLIATGAAGQSKLMLVGEKGKVEVPEYWHATTATITMDNGAQEELTAPLTWVNEFSCLLNHVEDCLANGLTTSPRVTADRTVQAMTVIEDLYQAWYGDPLN